MKILQFSDLHGRHMSEAERLIARHRPDWIVLTGDILPDFHLLGGTANRLDCQRGWWTTYRSSFQWDGAVTTLTLGNHEIEGFRDPILQNATPSVLEGRVGVLQGNPTEFGAWGFSREYEMDELQREVDALNQPKVILSHCPPHGWLDGTRNGDRIGHRSLRAFLEETAEPPLLVLCGHVHESFGELRQGQTLIVNASEGYALIHLDLKHGLAEVIAMARLGDENHGGEC